MPRFEADETYHQHTLEIESPESRPPQLNMTICGCRCGCGCAHSDGEGGNDDDALIPELTDDESDDTLADFSPLEDNENFNNAEDRDEFAGQLPTTLHSLENVSEGMTEHAALIRDRDLVHSLAYRAIGPEHLGLLQVLDGLDPDDEDESLDSMRNEAVESDARSVVSSAVACSRLSSPGPGLGTWASGYHFLSSPLRLTPQRRGCRGLVAAHLIWHDDELDYGDCFHWRTLAGHRTDTEPA